MQRFERFSVGDSAVLGPADLAQVAVLRSHAGIVQASADGVGLHHLPLLVLQQQTHGAMQHSGAALGDGGGMAAAGHPFSGSFDTDESHAGVSHEGMEQAHGIGAPTDAGKQHIR